MKSKPKPSIIKPKRQPNPLLQSFKKPVFQGGKAPKMIVTQVRRNSYGGGGGRGK